MATRSRGRRGQASAPVPAPRAGTRSTRNAGPQTNDDMIVEDTQDQMMQGESLARDPPPRRSAPVAPSDVTIPTRPEDGSEQDGEVSEEAEEVEHQNSQDQVHAEPEESVEEETDEVRLGVMAAGLPDAQRLSTDLWMRLKEANHDSQQYRLILNMKRRAFKVIREEYEDPSIAPFIDTRRLRLLDEQFDSQGSVFTILHMMNLTSALDLIDRLHAHGSGSEATSRADFLQTLAGGAFRLLVNGDLDDSGSPQMLLEIHTQLLIEKFAAEKSISRMHNIISDVFCFGAQMDGGNWSNVFSHGPFVYLGGGKDASAIQVADRIQEILGILKRHDHSAIPVLRETYRSEDFLDHLRKFIIKLWPAASDADVFYDAADSLNMEGTPVGITRLGQQPGSAPPRHVSQSIQDLARMSPSARRQTTGLVGHQSSYPSPPAHMASIEASRAAAQSLAELGEHEHLAATEDDDAFQTDTRNLTAIPARRPPPTSAQPRAVKRQRINDANLPPSSMPPPSTAPPQYSTQPGATPDFEAIKAKKRALSAQARAERGEAPTQQRKPWSSADCTTLLHCIYERHASWSQIQAEDSHKFEVPRNQQAYRDKARNMKVDYLITDAVLPPCFDLVALGSKEKARLIAMGKNPNRREADLDENNQPINISYISPQDQQQQLADSLSQAQSQSQSQPEVSQQAPEPQMA